MPLSISSMAMASKSLQVYMSHVCIRECVLRIADLLIYPQAYDVPLPGYMCMLLYYTLGFIGSAIGAAVL